MTEDFIEDAVDSLVKGECCYVLIAANFSSPNFHTAANLPTREHMEVMRRRFDEMCERVWPKEDS